MWAQAQAAAPLMTVMLATIGAATAVTLYVADSKSKVKELEVKLQAQEEKLQAEKELRAKDVQAARSDAESFTMQKLFAAGFAAEYEAYREKIAEETRKRMAVKGEQ